MKPSPNNTKEYEMTSEIPGMILNEPNAVYHARKDCVSFSDLKKLIHSPELYRKHMDGLLPSEHKDAWDVGNAVHTAILEPDKIGEYYFTDGTYKGSTKEGKAIKSECVEKGITLLNASNSSTALRCVKALKESHAIRLFEHGDPEVVFRVEGSNLKLQCRTDWICHKAPAGLEAFGINEGERYVADLKTTRSVSDWMEEARWKNPLTNDLLYSGQEAYYTPIIDSVLNAAGIGMVDKWVFVVVEKEEPNRVAVIRTSKDVLLDAESKVNNALVRLIDRNKLNEWTDERLDGVYEPQIYIS
jgi:hypothetical protein